MREAIDVRFDRWINRERPGGDGWLTMLWKLPLAVAFMLLPLWAALAARAVGLSWTVAVLLLFIVYLLLHRPPADNSDS